MMTEEELKKYEALVHQLNRGGREWEAHAIAHLCQYARSLQKRIAELENQAP